MNWDQSKKRWHRFHKGTMYRVTASALGGNTRDNTRQAANEWWKQKYLEIEGPPPKSAEEILIEQTMVAVSPTEEEVEQTFGPLLDLLELSMPKAKEIGRTIQATAESFLLVLRTTMKPLSFREIRDNINALTKQLGEQTDVAIFDEDRIEQLYLALRDSGLSDGVKKKRWGFLRRYVKYIWSKRLVDLPRNLDSFSFEVSAKAIKTYTPAEVRKVLNSIKPRFQLYALFGLNCGMTSADIGQLRKDQINREKGTLTRRRAKTGHIATTPTVCYKLWPETLHLLEQCWSGHDTLALTSMDGTPLSANPGLP